jgi:beta-lactamase class A
VPPTPNPHNTARLSRRSLLFAAGALPGLAACSTAKTFQQAPPPSSAPPPTGDAERALAELEKGFGRLGVYALDTGSGAEIRHRADERFALCSTFKVLAAASVLRLDTSTPGLLARRIHYRQSDLVDGSPVTSQHVGDGMTVSDLCAAAITHSDNTAANQLLTLIGGPAGVTAIARGLGDPVTGLTRTEPSLNNVPPGTTADTTTPARMGANLRELVLGNGLAPSARATLTDWLVHNATGATRLRAGLPTGWRVGDKTGSGFRGEINDVAVVWPPGHAPLILSVYSAPKDPHASRPDILAASATIVAKALVPKP